MEAGAGVVDGGCRGFKTANELLGLLQGTEKEQVLLDVPKGPKWNVCFVVDNSLNVRRREDGLKNQFWDDCGVWSSKNGRVVTTTYMKSGKLLSLVKLQNGVYCKKQKVDGKVGWTPLHVQPTEDSVLSMSSYYATLKSDTSYRKRVSWIVSSPNVAVYEYQGKPPARNQPHGCARHTDTEFIRTKPQVLRDIRQGLKRKHANPRDVYEELALANESGCKPRDHKQVRNQAQVLAKQTGHKKGANVADEMLSVITGMNSHPFVKRVILRQGFSPVIVAYTDQQVQDLKRFCCPATPPFMRTVVGVDRTFNLGSCFVTVTVYRNMSVLRKTTRDHPIFLGPVMLHFDGRADTYTTFFRCLKDAVGSDLSCAEMNGDVELVFGSDEEKAMVAALKEVFPEAGHVFCMQHIEENVRRYMTDEVGVPVNEREDLLSRVRAAGEVKVNDTVDGEQRLTELLQTARSVAASTDNCAKLLTYVTDTVIPKLRSNIHVVRDNGWVSKHWTNNNAESVNHLLKLKADWRQLPIASIVDNIHDMVKLSFVDLRSSLCGQGNFVLIPAMSRHLVPYTVWSVTTADRKTELFTRFLRDNGSRVKPAVVTSQDGALTMPATPKVARKPGQKSRPRSTKTRISRRK